MAALKRKQLRHVKRAFRSFAGADLLIDYPEWKQTLGIKNDFLLKRIFQLVDTDESGFIDADEFAEFAANLFYGDKRKRLEFIFRVYDINDDGAIDGKEIKQILDASLVEQQVKLSDEVVGQLVKDFLQRTDIDKDRKVSMEEFVRAVGEYPGIDEQFSVRAANWFDHSRRIRMPRIAAAAIGLRLKRWWQSYRKPLAWAAMYVGANAFMFADAMQRYAAADAPVAVQIARGAGACLDLNVALILIPMCKSVWTWIKQTPLAKLFPLEDVAGIHRMLGRVIVMFTSVHVAAHLVNYWNLGWSIPRQLVATQVGITGAVATLIVALMLWSGSDAKKRKHEILVWTHYLYGVFFVALIFHSDKLLPWLVPPLLLFLGDSLVRALRKTSTVKAVTLTPLANGVTRVAFDKPKHFKFYPGDYLRLQVPEVSRLQWHPFTISAAPEAEQVCLYIRNNGDWSGALHNLSRKKTSQGKAWLARIDGPYATPSSKVHRAKVAVLVAAGIGVTPFASILQSVVLRTAQSQDKAQNKTVDQHIYFHWLNRSQRSYEWFIDLLTEAERVLGNDKFKLHIHLTSLTHDLTNIAMQVAMDAYRDRRERDPITGLFVETSAGRPDWDAIFNRTAGNHPDDAVDVFFCGPPMLGATVEKNCRKHGFLFHDEKF